MRCAPAADSLRSQRVIDDGVGGEDGARVSSPTGRSQAARLAERLAAEQSSLKISRVYSPCAPRAAQTAAVVADMLGLSVHTQLLGPTGRAWASRRRICHPWSSRWGLRGRSVRVSGRGSSGRRGWAASWS
ncbi:histidine phosphatase family protein [Nocardia araoensis]|uniref:histidine phosphatase family protein n=1 Tax=Nocardia araoensis TaxID=228600 RepID=UPI0009FBBEF1